jgi:hypothetical protein
VSYIGSDTVFVLCGLAHSVLKSQKKSEVPSSYDASASNVHFPIFPSNHLTLPFHVNVGSDRQMITFTGEKFRGLVDMPEGMGLVYGKWEALLSRELICMALNIQLHSSSLAEQPFLSHSLP